MRQILRTQAYYIMQRSVQPLHGSRVADLSTQLADFSRMQPTQPNPWHIVYFIFIKMISVAGAKEAELQGASSVVRRNEAMEAVAGET